jgi:aminotransferase
MAIPVSQSVTQLPPSGIRRYFDIAATMEDVVSLGIGEPDFPTPTHIMEAGFAHALAGGTGYTANAGMAALREAITAAQYRRYGLSYHPNTETLVTVGASEAIFLAMKALLNPGDEVLVVEPCFVANPAAVELVGGVPVMVPTSVEHDFQVTAEDLESRITGRTRAIFISYPNNPTGAILSQEYTAAVAEVARRHDLVIVSDEIYEQLVYDHEPVAIAAMEGMQERTVVISGMSKAYAMTGWRIGYALGPEEIIRAMAKVHQYLIMSAPTIAQVMAIHAIAHGAEDVQVMRAAYNERRRLIVDGLNALGLPTFEPRGAFYAFPDLRGTGMSDEAFCEALLHEAHVAIIPGRTFGPSGAGFARASYATSRENIVEALARIGDFLARRHLLTRVPAVTTP